MPGDIVRLDRFRNMLEIDADFPAAGKGVECHPMGMG